MTVNNIAPRNVKPSDLVKITVDSKMVATGSVDRVTKTQIICTVLGDTARFRRSDGKEVSSNGALIKEGTKLNLRDILRFS